MFRFYYTIVMRIGSIIWFVPKMRKYAKHPERYSRLVVRIWGWSAYFVELDEEFQNHVIARQEYSDF